MGRGFFGVVSRAVALMTLTFCLWLPATASAAGPKIAVALWNADYMNDTRSAPQTAFAAVLP
jgi:hypothetical protein